MKSYKKSLHIIGIMTISILSLTLGIQDNATAMTVPGTEIVTGTPEPITIKTTDVPSDKENSSTKKEDKPACPKKMKENTEEKPELQQKS